jgi:hypothetical protein
MFRKEYAVHVPATDMYLGGLLTTMLMFFVRAIAFV